MRTPENARTMHLDSTAAPPPRQLSNSFVLATAYRRLERAILRDEIARPAPRPPLPLSRRPGEKPVVTLAAPRRFQIPEAAPIVAPQPALRADPGALATALAGELVAKLDELAYLWSVVREAEPFCREGEPALSKRAAELALLQAGGAIELPIEALLRAVRSFLDEHGMDEEYVRRLCAWYGV